MLCYGCLSFMSRLTPSGRNNVVLILIQEKLQHAVFVRSDGWPVYNYIKSDSYRRYIYALRSREIMQMRAEGW